MKKGKSDSESTVHFTVGSLRQTSRRAGGVDFKGELGLVKAALLYADGVELISVGASFAAGMDEFGRLATPEKLILLRRFRQGEEHVKEGGTPVATQQVSEREPDEDGDDHCGL